MTDFEAEIARIVLFARVSERLFAAMSVTKYALESLRDVAALDGDLGPEVGAAADHLSGAHDALGRAFVFAQARLDTKPITPE